MAQRFAERFGEGTASYVEVRDRFRGDELSAWLAYFAEWDRHEKLRKAQAEHDSTMGAVAKALKKH